MKQSQITFPLNYTIQDNPRGYCKEISKVKQVFERGIEDEIVAEIKRLNTIDPNSNTLRLLAVTLQELLPHKYHSNDYIAAKKSVVDVTPKRRRRNLILLIPIIIFIAIAITLAVIV
jgi:predicted transport protein